MHYSNGHFTLKVNKYLANLETGRSKTLIYDTYRQSNLNANAFSTEPADYNCTAEPTDYRLQYPV